MGEGEKEGKRTGNKMVMKKEIAEKKRRNSGGK
jgi:hypothetical protein